LNLKTGCNAVSWSPAFTPNENHHQIGNGNSTSAKRIVYGGCDNLVKIWCEDHNGEWILEQTLTGHSDWVRDVAWSPNVMQSRTNIASCSQV
jgi:protein transport protein SEC13